MDLPDNLQNEQIVTCVRVADIVDAPCRAERVRPWINVVIEQEGQTPVRVHIDPSGDVEGFR